MLCPFRHMPTSGQEVCCRRKNIWTILRLIIWLSLLSDAVFRCCLLPRYGHMPQCCLRPCFLDGFDDLVLLDLCKLSLEYHAHLRIGYHQDLCKLTLRDAILSHDSSDSYVLRLCKYHCYPLSL